MVQENKLKKKRKENSSEKIYLLPLMPEIAGLLPSPQEPDKDQAILEKKDVTSAAAENTNIEKRPPLPPSSKKREEPPNPPLQSIPTEIYLKVKEGKEEVSAVFPEKAETDTEKSFDNPDTNPPLSGIHNISQEQVFFGIGEDVPYSLKNGMVGQEYSASLDFDKICPNQKITDYTIEGLKQIEGLTLDVKNGVIHGTPGRAGEPAKHFEFELTVRYQTKDKRDKKEILIKILPNPKTLFKEIEPPASMGDRKAHTFCKLKKIGKDKNGKARVMLCASKRGRSHAHRGLFRDDHVKISYMDDEKWGIIAVADGAGSAKLSRVGSQIACEASTEFLIRQLRKKNEILTSVIDKTYNQKENNKVLRKLLYDIIAAAAFTSAKAIQEEVKKRKVDKKNFSTTLLLAIYKSFSFGNFFASFWVGDGALAVYDKEQKPEEQLRLFGKPDVGEFSGETLFITIDTIMNNPKELLNRISFGLNADDFTALLVMTDGISDPKFITEGNLEKVSYWDKLWQELEENVIKSGSSDKELTEKLLEWLDFWVEGEHDDRTIAILF